jgi:hypothetical protein
LQNNSVSSAAFVLSAPLLEGACDFAAPERIQAPIRATQVSLSIEQPFHSQCYLCIPSVVIQSPALLGKIINILKIVFPLKIWRTQSCWQVNSKSDRFSCSFTGLSVEYHLQNNLISFLLLLLNHSWCCL